VAEPTATPGGGSVSALAGALAASLGQMVAGLSRKKKSQAAHIEALAEALDAMRRTTDELAQAIDEDASAYDAVLAAHKLPQGNAEETRRRDIEIQAATRAAAEIPLRVAERAVALCERLGQLESISAASMRSDLKVAQFMAAAGARGAMENVEINLESILDAPYAAAVRGQLESLRKRLGDSARKAGA
jgi:formiminotetrahydrofolate cyclodeaminase